MAKTYQPNQIEPFKLSRSKIELFTKCPYCFYLDRRLGISQPSGPAFSLNLAVDTLLKNECDGYRVQKCAHPIAIENNLEAIPYQTTPPDLIEIWRNNREGIAFLTNPPISMFMGPLMIYGSLQKVS